MTMFREKPHIEFPRQLIDMGFEDNSSAGAVCAEALKFLTTATVLQVWIAEEDPEARAYATVRYAAQVVDDTDRVIGEVYYGDDLASLIAAVKGKLNDA